MEQKKALIGLSGGVDSSVAAYLMQRTYQCSGATIRLCGSDLLHAHSSCGASDSIADAQAIADRLNMPFYVFDATDEFCEKVVNHFVRSYEQGLTPNPCIDCNRHLKFEKLLEHAFRLGCDYIATGHYAVIRQDPDTHRYLLCKATDAAKDQTYFLASLTQDQLKHIRFPLGELTKAQVREIAQQQGFINAKKRDSQDICFIPDGDYKAFLERYTGNHYEKGHFLDLQGNVVGTHNGAVGYTLGQRKGTGLALGEPVYVCSKDMQANTVTVGPNSALYTSTLIASHWNWISIAELSKPMRISAKVRSRHTEQPATVYPMDNDLAKVVFDQPQRAVTPGQAVVLYLDDMVVGSGTITETIL